MVYSISFEEVIAIIGVIGTWVGVYVGYRAIKKNNEQNMNKITNLINSNNKINTQMGRGNQNAQ